MDNTENIISFCTGYGGIELGLHRVIENLRTVCYVEIETFAIANLVAKIEQGKMDAAPIWSDIKTFPAQIFRDKVHGIVGGYPCQPFSAAGKRKGTADPRHLWPYILGHIRTIRPVWCFFENVSGHLTLGFDEVFKSLRDLGYSVEAGLFTACECISTHIVKIEDIDGKVIGEVEVCDCPPHKRQRLFILAYSDDQPDGQNTGGNEKKEEIQGEHRQALCRGGITGAGQQLADTEQQRPIQSKSTARHRQRLSKDGSLRPPVADTKYKGLQGRQRTGGIDKERWQEQDGPTPQCRQLYPARPGQEQYEWEEPRTVKLGMGRTVDGFKSRVDELRLLGNGVVPAQAELAFRSLSNNIIRIGD